MRGYLTKTGVGLLAGIVMLTALTATMTSRPARTTTLAAQAPARIGPFCAAVERYEVRELRDGACVASVQVHLWRPEGPVPLEQRIRIDGTASLGAGWTLRDREWLVRNEFGRFPEGDTYYDAWLGAVPATRHAGEARAVFTFTFDPATPGAACPLGETELALVLPGGEAVSLEGLRAVAR